jgi:hypothetical protein
MGMFIEIGVRAYLHDWADKRIARVGALANGVWGFSEGREGYLLD